MNTERPNCVLFSCMICRLPVSLPTRMSTPFVFIAGWLLPPSHRWHSSVRVITLFLKINKFSSAYHTAWDSLRCLSKFATLSRDSNISNFSAAIISPLTWSTSEAHGTFGVGS